MGVIFICDSKALASAPSPPPIPSHPTKKTNHMKTHSDHELSRLEAVGNGSYLYRWDIHTDFLRRRAELKKEIDSFCAERGIR